MQLLINFSNCDVIVIHLCPELNQNVHKIVRLNKFIRCSYNTCFKIDLK